MKKPIQYIILTCALSWAVAGAAILLGLRSTQGQFFKVIAFAYMLIPAVCAIILQAIHREKPFRNLNISFKLKWWFLIAGTIPVIYTFLTLGINLLFPNVSFSTANESLLSRFPPFIFLLMLIAKYLIVGYTLSAFLGFGEELGWRGYLLKALKDKKFLFASLIIGVVWGLWHFPFILIGLNYPQHPVAGVGIMIIFCILLTPMMIYIVIKSKSVITAAIFHGVINAIGLIPNIYLSGGNDITNGVTGIAGFIALLLIDATLYLYDKYITKENIFTKIIGEY